MTLYLEELLLKITIAETRNNSSLALTPALPLGRTPTHALPPTSRNYHPLVTIEQNIITMTVFIEFYSSGSPTFYI